MGGIHPAGQFETANDRRQSIDAEGWAEAAFEGPQRDKAYTGGRSAASVYYNHESDRNVRRLSNPDWR